MNRLGFLRGFMTREKDLEKEFVDMLLEDNVVRATAIAKKLVSTGPMLLSILHLADFLQDPTNLNKKSLFIKSLKETVIKSDLIWMLCKKGLLITEVQVYVDRIRTKDHMYYLILKEIYVHGHKIFGERNDVECIEFLLDHLDDWDLYQYALDKDVDLRNRSSLNHAYYLLHRYKDRDRAIEILGSRSCFKEIQFIVDLVDLDGHPDTTMDCIIQLMRHGYSEGLLLRAYDIYRTECNVLTVKMLLGVLVASRRPKFLILAMYMSYLHRRMDPSNYEMSLIFMFLCRYFSFYPHVLKLFNEMDIKNAQIPNLCFIVSDIVITKRLGCNKIKEFLDGIRGCISDLKNGLRYFITTGKIAYAIDALELYRDFSRSIVLQELESNAILGSNPVNSFSYLLGEHGSYIFEKMTVEHLPQGETMLLTDFFVPDFRCKVDLLDNGIHDITDEGFRMFFDELVEYHG